MAFESPPDMDQPQEGVPSLPVICSELRRSETALHAVVSFLSAQVARHVPHRKHPVLLELRSLSYTLLDTVDTAMDNASYFLDSCCGTFRRSYRPGRPLGEKALRYYEQMSSACRRAADALPIVESRLDQLARLLVLELGVSPGYIYFLRALRHIPFAGLGSRASLVDDIPILMHAIKSHMREIVDLLQFLHTRLIRFQMTFQDSDWASHACDADVYVEALLDVSNLLGTHALEVHSLMYGLRDGDGLVWVDPRFTRNG